MLDLKEAVAELVRDGVTVALESFTHLIPFAAAHEIIRQEIEILRDLRARTEASRRRPGS